MNKQTFNEKVFSLKTARGYNAVLVTENENVQLIVHSGWDDNCTQELYWCLDMDGTAQLGCSLYHPITNLLIDCFVVVLSPEAKVELKKAMPCDVTEVNLPDNVIPLFGFAK